MCMKAEGISSDMLQLDLFANQVKARLEICRMCICRVGGLVKPKICVVRCEGARQKSRVKMCRTHVP